MIVLFSSIEENMVLLSEKVEQSWSGGAFLAKSDDYYFISSNTAILMSMCLLVFVEWEGIIVVKRFVRGGCCVIDGSVGVNSNGMWYVANSIEKDLNILRYDIKN